MAQICRNLNELIINNCRDYPGLISLIDAQRNLKSVTIRPNLVKKGTCNGLGKALLRKSNTINSLRLYSISIIPPSCLTSFVNLKKISLCCHKYYDGKEEIDQFQQYLAILEFPTLEILHIHEVSCFKELSMLIEKTNGNILAVNVYKNDARDAGMLIKAIANSCPKIRELSINIEPKDFMHVKPLLLNCKQLKCLNLNSSDFSAEENGNIGDELLDILTKFSPNSLTDVRISAGWKYSINSFEQFFESCRKRTLYFFVINNCSRRYITKEHEEIVNKYVEEGVISCCIYPMRL